MHGVHEKFNAKKYDSSPLGIDGEKESTIYITVVGHPAH